MIGLVGGGAPVAVGRGRVRIGFGVLKAAVAQARQVGGYTVSGKSVTKNVKTGLRIFKRSFLGVCIFFL